MDVVERLRATFSSFSGIRLAVLFGSVARGRATPRSDVDVGVLLAEDDPGQLWDIDVAAAAALRRTIDLVDLGRSPPLLRFEVARNGIPILERSDGEWTRFRARAMLDWWEWAPTARMFYRLAAERVRERLGDGET